MEENKWSYVYSQKLEDTQIQEISIKINLHVSDWINGSHTFYNLNILRLKYIVRCTADFLWFLEKPKKCLRDIRTAFRLWYALEKLNEEMSKELMNFTKFLNILAPSVSVTILRWFKKKKIWIDKRLTGLGILWHSLATNRKTFPKSGFVFHLFITKHRAQTNIVNGYPNGMTPRQSNQYLEAKAVSEGF